MNCLERPGIASAFKACLPHLWNGVDSHSEGRECICFALIKTKYPFEHKARRAISSRLEGAGTLEGWLRYKRMVPSEDITDARLQAHRKAWVKQLIKEFSNADR